MILELSTSHLSNKILRRDIPWEIYMTTRLISGTDLQLLRRYDKMAESYKSRMLDDDGPAYILVFITIYEPSSRKTLLLWKSNWFIQDKTCKILSLIVIARTNVQNGFDANGDASNSKRKVTSVEDVLNGLAEWLCEQLRKPSHPSHSIPSAINCLATLLKEPIVRCSFVQADGVKLLVPLISPVSTQQSIQLLYEICLCVWLLSYYEPAIEYLATSRALPQLIEVVKGSTKEKVVRVVILTLRNLLVKGTFGAQMVDLDVLQTVQSFKAQAWSDEYKQEVLLGSLDWFPMHKDPLFWKENINCFEENGFQILRVLITILEPSNDARTLAVACYDLSQFIQCHPAGQIIVANLKVKERVMKLLNHDTAEVTKTPCFASRDFS
ncbi:unnamed protein product [Withania somnifera]